METGSLFCHDCGFENRPNRFHWLKEHQLFLSLLVPVGIVIFLSSFLGSLEYQTPSSVAAFLNSFSRSGLGYNLWLTSFFVLGLISPFGSFYLFLEENPSSVMLTLVVYSML
ncbi:MAG: hypothetical protein ACFFBD_02650 [Candidatus Hodarchaeota archaeon]